MAEESGKTKYFALMEMLRDEILSGRIKPGEKLPSENELAAEHHISRHTVRKALDILNQEGYIHAVHGKGTFCSERMGHMRQSHNIGVITTYISDYIFPRLIQGMDKVFSANGYSIILKNTGNSRQMERICLEDILKKDIDGLIIEPSKSELLCKHTSLYEKMDSFGIPYVFIQGVYEQMAERPHILMDDCQGGYLVTKYLLSLGHRSLLGIFKADDRQGRERHKGYVKALQEAGILYDPDRVIWFHTEDRGSKPFLMTVKLLDRHVPVDGIVCYNDQTAVKMIHTLKKRGIQVPGDISVTGYDNSSMSREEGFNLTTIAHPQEKLGEMAAELLLEQIRGVPETASHVQTLIEPELIVRGSCKAI